MALPPAIVAAEDVAKEWKKVFAAMKVRELVQAETLVTAWEKHSVLKKENPVSLRKALDLASGWNAKLRWIKPKAVEAAHARIREITGAPEASLFFDGKTLYWWQQGKETSWPAYSGREEYWGKNNFSLEAQERKDKGPMPEGTYLVAQNRFQIRDSSFFEFAKQQLGKNFGSWRGNYNSWGNQRIWIEPGESKHPIYNRKDLTIHG